MQHGAAAAESEARPGAAEMARPAETFSGERVCTVTDLGGMTYAKAWERQLALVERRKRGEIVDQLLFVEHPHVITMGRNGHPENVLASEEVLARTGIAYEQTNRGGDVTYHGPGQLVGYPIMDLKEWKRDVVGYVRTLEQALIEALAEFDMVAEREAGATGVWVAGRKIAAIGVHISRWVTCHGFALNVTTDLQYFQYIVPCGLTKPVTSMAAERGARVDRAEVMSAVTRQFGRAFGRRMEPQRAETVIS